MKVQLNVRDEARSRAFYRDLLGAEVVLHENPQAQPATGRAGLYHVAFLYASRADLGAALRRLAEHGWPLEGASDHLVSEALYLRDPDGLGVELYRDRPREEWPYRHGRLQMGTDPLDLQALLDDAGPVYVPPTGVGHVHLQVLDLERSRKFYEDLGLEVMVELPDALFMARDGYHHHLGLNRWARPSLPASDETVGLRSFTLPGERPALTDPSGVRVSSGAHAVG